MRDDLTGLGRIKSRDNPADRWQVPKEIIKAGASLTYKYWTAGPRLDQLDTPQCVAFAGKGLLSSSPFRQAPKDTEKEIYDWCQDNDEWPGDDYDGTSVHALMRYLKANGYISSYEWTDKVDVLHAHLMTRGPAVLGTNWTYDMFTPDRWGYIRPTGGTAGGHAYLVRGSNKTKIDPFTKKFGALRQTNSWGTGWGDNGESWMLWSDAQRLIDEDGEVALAIEILKK